MNLVQSNHFANSTLALMTLFAITNYHWPICLMDCSYSLQDCRFHTGFCEG
jgi:hypothetical protein